MPGPLLAIDGPFVLYRSFFALPDSIKGAVGRPINALLGAANIVLRIAADQSPRSIAICFGAEAARYRKHLYPDYHAARPPVPEDLDWQFQRAPELFEAFGWSCLDSDGLEADDLLGALGTLEADAGGRALIMTGDRDLYQCATDRISVLFLKSGKVGFEAVDPAEVKRRYGIPPELVPDFIALRGDPSDGLPGAAGIGPKTAAELLRKHGSLAGAIAAADRERPKIAAVLRDCAEELRAFKEIATLQPVDGLERPPDRETDLAGGAQAARELGMGALAGRLEKAESLADL